MKTIYKIGDKVLLTKLDHKSSHGDNREYMKLPAVVIDVKDQENILVESTINPTGNVYKQWTNHFELEVAPADPVYMTDEEMYTEYDKQYYDTLLLSKPFKFIDRPKKV